MKHTQQHKLSFILHTKNTQTHTLKHILSTKYRHTQIKTLIFTDIHRNRETIKHFNKNRQTDTHTQLKDTQTYILTYRHKAQTFLHNIHLSHFIEAFFVFSYNIESSFHITFFNYKLLCYKTCCNKCNCFCQQFYGIRSPVS